VNRSAKTEYACLAVLELAAKYGSGEPVRVRTIADRQGIPSPFLVQILLQLKSAGVVESTRGSAGGYRLTRDPATLSLGEVVSMIEGVGGDRLGGDRLGGDRLGGDRLGGESVAGERGEGPGADAGLVLASGDDTGGAAAKRVLRDAWIEAEAARREALARITFADLLERSRGRSEAMYYI
jgi:DNA-binding IscR family transcriptional regulator